MSRISSRLRTNSRPIYAFMLVVLGLTLFSFSLASSSLWDNDESTYAEIAKEMVQQGHWLTTMFNHQVWFCHPPMYMWLTAILFKIAGWSELTARLFPALFAVLGMLVAFEFGAVFWDEKIGFWTAVILGTSLQYLIQGRMATMDSMLNASLLLAFYSGWRGFNEKKEKWWILFFLTCALATLTKGIFGIVYPVFIFTLFLLSRREITKWREVPWLKGMILYLVIAAPWFIYETVKFHNGFVYPIFYFYTYQRVVSPILSQSGPFYYYFPVLLFGFLPWSGFLPALTMKIWMERFDPKVLFLGIWVAATFLFFTFVKTKLPNYIFFLYAPLAMLLSYFWDKFTSRQKFIGIFTTLLIIFLLAVGLKIVGLQKLSPEEMAGYLEHLFPLLGILAAGCVSALLTQFVFKKQGFVLPCLVAGIAFFWFSFIVSFGPVMESYKPMKPLAEKLRIYEKQRYFPVVAYHVSGTASLIFYADTPISDVDRESLLKDWHSKSVYCFLEKDMLGAMSAELQPYHVIGCQRTLCLISNFSP